MKVGTASQDVHKHFLTHMGISSITQKESIIGSVLRYAHACNNLSIAWLKSVKILK